tara:strand:- start:216 stop:572 length:357 start_codon:yes stop_codon:yes gene_type:complete
MGELTRQGVEMGAYLAELLVIEDDQVLSAQLGELLRLQGYAVRLSPLGESGLAMALASAPDLVLLDVMLPDVSGFSVLRRLREQQQTPVIMLTACVPRRNVSEACVTARMTTLPNPST